MKILLATHNKHKIAELLKILPQTNNKGEEIIYLSFADFPLLPEPEEAGSTLKENAALKAAYGLRKTGLISLADDTGLTVDALNGAPGVHSARYAYPDRADYPANNEKLLKELSPFKKEQRSASFTTSAALALPGGEIIFKEGKVKGFITQEYKGENGFGYDPLFFVTEAGKTMAEMTAEEKNKISHRFRAFKQMAEIIKTL